MVRNNAVWDIWTDYSWEFHTSLGFFEMVFPCRWEKLGRYFIHVYLIQFTVILRYENLLLILTINNCMCFSSTAVVNFMIQRNKSEYSYILFIFRKINPALNFHQKQICIWKNQWKWAVFITTMLLLNNEMAYLEIFTWWLLMQWL